MLKKIGLNLGGGFSMVKWNNEMTDFQSWMERKDWNMGQSWIGVTEEWVTEREKKKSLLVWLGLQPVQELRGVKLLPDDWKESHRHRRAQEKKRCVWDTVAAFYCCASIHWSSGSLQPLKCKERVWDRKKKALGHSILPVLFGRSGVLTRTVSWRCISHVKSNFPVMFDYQSA